MVRRLLRAVFIWLMTGMLGAIGCFTIALTLGELGNGDFTPMDVVLPIGAVPFGLFPIAVFVLAIVGEVRRFTRPRAERLPRAQIWRSRRRHDPSQPT